MTYYNAYSESVPANTFRLVKEIAKRLHLSVGTVKQALHTAMGKAHVSSRGELGGLI